MLEGVVDECLKGWVLRGEGDERGLVRVSCCKNDGHRKGSEIATQKSAAAPFGKGSVPARALSVNMKRNSREAGGW